MWFKQIQLFQLSTSAALTAQSIAEKLQAFEFQPCLASMPMSAGWVSPLDEEGMPLTRGINGCVMICLQTEEKILPASVVAEHLKEKVKKIELAEGRRLRQKEKLTLKDETTQTLLLQAFTKTNRLYAIIDTRNNWLLINTASPKKIELFVSMLKKSFGDGIQSAEVQKPSAIMTHWLKTQDYPKNFSIEKSCVLQDPNEQHRVIRCQQQDLFSDSIQSLIKDGCDVMQMGLCWQDRVNFVLAHDFSLKSLTHAQDDIAEIKDELETKQQKFDADLLMMSETFAGLLTDLLNIFSLAKQEPTRIAIAV